MFLSLSSSQKCDDASASAAVSAAAGADCRPVAVLAKVEVDEDNRAVKRIYPSHVTVMRCQGGYLWTLSEIR